MTEGELREKRVRLASTMGLLCLLMGLCLVVSFDALMWGTILASGGVGLFWLARQIERRRS